MRALIKGGIDQALALGASYADVRVVESRQEELAARDGHICAASAHSSRGCGVRVIADGAWGFAAGSDLSPAAVSATASRAVQVAKASARVQLAPVDLSPASAVEGKYATRVRQDPFAVKLEDKVALLVEATKRLQREGIRVAEASAEFRREHKWFGNSDGTDTEQDITQSGAGLAATAVRGGEVQRRTSPNSFGGDYAAAGYEFVESLDLLNQADGVAEEALALLDAPPCPTGVTTLIVDGPQLALQVHESCGHAVELDRVLGTEAGFAGTSFLTLDKRGNYRYGAPGVNLTADATIPGGLGSYGFDDEGVPAQRVELVRDGIFQNYLTSRETGAAIGEASNGTMRAESWDSLPLIRMSNINLEPGDWTLSEIIRDTKEGVYLQTNRSWSIDDRRLNFQFGAEVAWEVRDGSIGRRLKNPVYTGITPTFWQSCDAIAGKAEWRVWGVPNCGKGEPVQTARVGHGTAPARFRQVRVGVE